jgi:hypothetical protein
MKTTNPKKAQYKASNLDMSKMTFADNQGTLYRTAFLNAFSRLLKEKRKENDFKSLIAFGQAFKIGLLVIFAAFTFSACQTSKAENVRPANVTIIEANAQSPNDIDDEKTDGYVCLGKTKTGARCKRRISEETYKAKGAYCWQHKAQDKNKKPVPCDTDTDCQEKNGN